MKKLLLLALCAVSFGAKSQYDNWAQYPHFDERSFAFSVAIYDEFMNQISPYTEFMYFHDSTYLEIMMDSMSVEALRFTEGLGLVKTDSNGFLLPISVADLPIGYQQIIDSLGFVPVENEADPVFSVSSSFGISAGMISNWNTAFGWGDHAGLYAPIVHAHTFASLTSKPTTLAGYGITDAYPLSGNPSGFITSHAGTSNYTAYSSGTAYNITTSSAKVDFGTTDPAITLGEAGTYVIMSNVRIDYTGLTNLAANTVTVKLRRTNNTATDLTNATGGFVVPPVTLLTATGGDCDINTVVYTTANNNDEIEVWASRSASISIGNIQAGNAWIVAYRIY